MSFLYYSDKDPRVNANFKDVKAKNFLQWNEDAQEYERVGVGGDGGVELPYYVKPNKIDLGISDSVNKSVLDETGLDVIDNANDTATHLDASALTFGDSSGNVSLEKGDVQVLKELQANTYSNPFSSSKLLIYNAGTAKYAQTPWRSYLGTTAVQLPSHNNTLTQVASSNISLRDSSTAGGTGAILSNSTLVIGTRPSADYALSNTSPQCHLNRTSVSVLADANNHATLESDGLTFAKDGEDAVSLQKPDVEMLKDLQTGSVAYPIPSSKLLILDANTGKHSTTRWRDYLESNSIQIPNQTVSLTRLQHDGLGIRDSTAATGTGTVIASDSVAVGTRSTSSFALDYLKPRTSLSTNSITVFAHAANFAALYSNRLRFRTGATTECALTSAMVTDLEKFYAKAQAAATEDDRLITFNPTTQDYKLVDTTSGEVLPKTYFVALGGYTAPTGDATMHHDGQSVFPRYAWLPDGILWSGSTANIIKYKLDIGDTIFFQSSLSYMSYPSFFYDTWYVVAFRPITGTYTNEQLKRSIVEGKVHRVDFPLGTPGVEDDVEATIDVRPARGSHVTIPAIAFRIKGKVVTKGENPDTTTPPKYKDIVKMKQISDRFYGIISFKVHSFDGGDSMLAPIVET